MPEYSPAIGVAFISCRWSRRASNAPSADVTHSQIVECVQTNAAWYAAAGACKRAYCMTTDTQKSGCCAEEARTCDTCLISRTCDTCLIFSGSEYVPERTPLSIAWIRPQTPEGDSLLPRKHAPPPFCGSMREETYRLYLPISPHHGWLNFPYHHF